MENIYDLIIVGGGPAGISAGIYAARQKLKTLLITKSFGGQMTRKAVEIKNYPGFEEISGFDLIQKMEKHLKKQEIIIEIDAVKEIKRTASLFDIITGTKKEFQSKAVILASGADPRPLEVPGEKEFIGKGVSYCVTCDGPLFTGKTVAVIGGGNAGFEAALSLINLVKKIYILESSDILRANQEIQEKVKKIEKIEVLTSIIIKEVKGDKFVKSIVFENKKNKQLQELPVEGIFVEIGSQPATAFVKDLVDFNEKDEIIIDSKTMETKTPGLFAAGDISEVVYKQIIVASGEGAKAALSASNYITKI